MWVKLNGEFDRALYVNSQQVSAVRQPSQGSTGARLAYMNGSVVAVRQSFEKITGMLKQGSRRGAGLWIFLTNENGKPVAVNFDGVRAVRPGPGKAGGEHTGLPAGLHTVRGGVARGDRRPHRAQYRREREGQLDPIGR